MGSESAIPTRRSHAICGRAFSHRAGFSFVEILFAVILLGIGAIMIAAVFPVAIQQTKATTNETVAAAVAREGISYLEQVSTSALMPASGTASVTQPGRVFMFGDSRAGAPGTNLWNAVKGNLILPNDPRYAWVPLYRRAGDPAAPATASNYVQVFVIAVQVRNRSAYSAIPDVSFSPANLQPKLVSVTFQDGGAGGTDTVQFTGAAVQSGAAAEGTYVIVSDCTTTPVNNGRIFRLGNLVSGTTWALAPGNDMSENNSATFTAQAMIVGRSLANPAAVYSSSNLYDGPAQDIAIYTTFVQVN